VVPAYNASGTISRALESIASQSESDLEVIIVDDGSTDDLSAALGEYREKVTLVTQNNQGPAAARNRGAREARGRFLAFLDADDFWHSRKLELQLAAFKARPDVAYCSTGGRFWTAGLPDPRYEVLAPGKTVAEYTSDFSVTFSNPYLGTPAIMMRTEIFASLNGFREDLQSAEDIDLWLRAAYRNTVAHIPAQLFFIVASRHSLTVTQGERVFANNLRVIEDFCRQHPEFLSERATCVRRARSKVFENWGSGELTNGNLVYARDLLMKSLRERITLRGLFLYAKAISRNI
jgi:glycosyltransferase involved in cell wall biosynthesis